MRTGGQLLVEGLKRWGVEVLFGLPGVQLDWLFDAIAQDGTIRVIHTRHEQATSYMADGYAKATGRVGVCAVVPGPGVLNAGAGLATAYACNSPVLCLAGQVLVRDLGQGRGALHEIPDQLAVLRGTVGWAERAMRPEEIPALVDAAFTRLTSAGRTRPAAIEVGWDTLMREADAPWPAKPQPAPVPEPDPEAIEAAAALLVDAKRPLIWAGGGVMDAGPQLAALAETLGAPVALTPEGKGALSDRVVFTVPQAAGLALLPEADALVIVGSRFYGGGGPPVLDDRTKVVRIDVDHEELERNVTPTVAIEADAAAACRDLAAAVQSARTRLGEAVDLVARTAELAELRKAVTGGLAERFPLLAGHSAALRDALPDDGILVDEMTQVGYFARNGYPTYRPRTYLGSGYQGTLGFGYPTALGAKVGAPDDPVISITGDGGFLYNLGELATAMHHHIAVVVVVFHDGAYGNVKRIQAQTFGREIASTLTNPDFSALARSFGMAAFRAEDPAALRKTLDRALELDAPALIEVPIGPQPDIWPTLLGRDPLVRTARS